MRNPVCLTVAVAVFFNQPLLLKEACDTLYHDSNRQLYKYLSHTEQTALEGLETKPSSVGLLQKSMCCMDP